MPTPQDNLATRLIKPCLERGWSQRVALREDERTWTYGQLADRVARVSSVLDSLGLGRGDRVAVLMRDSLEAAAALLGIVHMGAVAVPLSELSRALDIRQYLTHCGAVAAIVHGALEPVIDEIRREAPELREVVCVSQIDRPGVHSFHDLVDGAEPAAQAAPVRPTDTALLMYSAIGLEQELRGIPHTHQTPLLAFDSFARSVIALGPDDRVFSIVRLSTAYGLGTGLFFPLAAGAETLLLPEQPRSDVVFDAVESFAPTVFLATPSLYGQLARDADATGRNKPLAGCRVCVSGAEGLPPKLVPRIRDYLGTEIMVGYGLTEAFQFVLAGRPGGKLLGRTGRPVPGFEARIIDKDGVPVGPDVIGTLQIRGPTLLRGYWGKRHQGAEFDDGWFTTRDRFMVDEAGNYYHCGRVDDLFKVSGNFVSPSEIERVLMAHEAVWDCAVIGADDEDGLIKPLAFVVPNIGHTPGEALERELRGFVKSELAPFKYPRWFEFVDRLPRGPAGKVLRYKLRPKQRIRRAETANGGS